MMETMETEELIMESRNMQDLLNKQRVLEYEKTALDFSALMLPVRSLTKTQMDDIHKAVEQVLKDEAKGTAVRAELFALLYICHPRALFKRIRYTNSVVIYTSEMMGVTSAMVSAYKKNLVFLYFNDKRFRAVVTRAIDAAINAADKNNSASN